MRIRGERNSRERSVREEEKCWARRVRNEREGIVKDDIVASGGGVTNRTR